MLATEGVAARVVAGGTDVLVELQRGVDPRRMVILAAEDIGLADPRALSVAVAAQQAAHFIGMPEGFLPLTEAALYLAAAPKSNSVLRAYVAAAADVAETLHQPVPLHLRNAVTGLGRPWATEPATGTPTTMTGELSNRNTCPSRFPGTGLRPVDPRR